MMKIFKNMVVTLFIILSILFMIIGTKDVMIGVNNAIMLWGTRVMPILFPFYIFTSLAVKYGVAHFIGDLIKPITRNLFKTSPISGFVFIMSLLSGNPSSAILISQLHDENCISKKEAGHLLNFSVFVNPLFCIGTIGYALFNNLTIGYIILIAHILGNIIIGILMRFSIKSMDNENFSIKTAYQKLVNQKGKNKKNFGEVMTTILQNGMNTMFLIGGFMIFYSVIIAILNTTNIITYSYQALSFILIAFNVDINTYKAFFVGLFEMVLGVDNVVKSNFPLREAVTFIVIIISFGGLSIHSQIQSILVKLKLRYFPFFLSRLAHATFSGIIAYYLFPLFYKSDIPAGVIFDSLKIGERNLLLVSIIILVLSAGYLVYKSRQFKIKMRSN